jgi:hypothetical protein
VNLTDGLLVQLSRPQAVVDRQRARLMSLGIAACGILLLAIVAFLTISDRTGPDGSEPHPSQARSEQQLAPFVHEGGLRGGTALVTALIMVPFLIFAYQALRTGTAARERRLAALSLAGASGRQLRQLAFIEGARAAVLGGLLAGPGYLAIWLVLGVMLPPSWRLLPYPTPVLLVAWPVLVVGLGVAGGIAASIASRPAAVSPLATARRQPRPLSVASAICPALALGVIIFDLPRPVWERIQSVWLAAAIMIVVVLVLGLTGGPWLVRAVGWWAATHGGLIANLAGRRMLADVRTPGRVAGTIFAVGVTIGIIGGYVAATRARLAGELSDPAAQTIYYGGAGIALVVALGAVLVATSSLAVGIREQILDGRKGTAALVAMAASPAFVYRVVRWQLILTTVPAAVIGAVAGWWLHDGGRSWSAGSQQWVGSPVPTLLAVTTLTGLTVALGAVLVARAVRPAIEASTTPDNLRG